MHAKITHIDIGIGVGITATIANAVTKYYALPFTSGGITLRLDVSLGYITCYASDTFRNPGPDNYVWLINTRGYADGFIDPASQFGRTGTRYIYIALVGVDALNTCLFNSTSGNFSSQGRKLCVDLKTNLYKLILTLCRSGYWKSVN